MNDPRLDTPAFHRNIEPIVALLKKHITASSLNWLEIGSGSGQHVVRFAQEFPSFTFQPTDITSESLGSISAWIKDSRLTNVREPILMNLLDDEWQKIDGQTFDLISAFNVIHISPWDVTKGLFRAAKTHGNAECRVLLYGPFRIDGKHTSESNAAFEAWLRAKNNAFGVRDIEDIKIVAKGNGYKLDHMHEMPANNFMLEFSNIGG